MVKATGLPKNSFCMACYDGDYPVKYDPAVDKMIIEHRRVRQETFGSALDKEQAQGRLL
jgi:amidophosphoribosyltransferase